MGEWVGVRVYEKLMIVAMACFCSICIPKSNIDDTIHGTFLIKNVYIMEGDSTFFSEN